MAIGSGRRLLVVGAVVSGAVGFTTFLMDLSLLGYLLMGSGVMLIAIILLNEFNLLFTSIASKPFVGPDSGERIVRNRTRPQAKTTSSYRY